MSSVVKSMSATNIPGTWFCASLGLLLHEELLQFLSACLWPSLMAGDQDRLALANINKGLRKPLKGNRNNTGDTVKSQCEWGRCLNWRKDEWYGLFRNPSKQMSQNKAQQTSAYSNNYSIIWIKTEANHAISRHNIYKQQFRPNKLPIQSTNQPAKIKKNVNPMAFPTFVRDPSHVLRLCPLSSWWHAAQQLSCFPWAGSLHVGGWVPIMSYHSQWINQTVNHRWGWSHFCK